MRIMKKVTEFFKNDRLSDLVLIVYLLCIAVYLIMQTFGMPGTTSCAAMVAIIVGVVYMLVSIFQHKYVMILVTAALTIALFIQFMRIG